MYPMGKKHKWLNGFTQPQNIFCSEKKINYYKSFCREQQNQVKLIPLEIPWDVKSFSICFPT